MQRDGGQCRSERGDQHGESDQCGEQPGQRRPPVAGGTRGQDDGGGLDRLDRAGEEDREEQRPATHVARHAAPVSHAASVVGALALGAQVVDRGLLRLQVRRFDARTHEQRAGDDDRR